MELDLILKVAYIGIPVIMGTIGFIVREHVSRIKKLERAVSEQAVHFVTKEELRQALADKVEPIREDIQEIKSKLDKLYDFLLKRD